MLQTAEPSLFDWQPGRKARDEGIEKVAENNDGWLKLALIQLEQIAKNPKVHGWGNLERGFTGETMREMVASVGKPRSPNAYGALVMTAIRRNIIVPTGRLVPMANKSSHYRKTMTYVFADGGENECK